MKYEELLKRYPIISDQISQASLGVVLRELEKVINRGIVGDVAEFGCYVGTTSLFLRRLMDKLDISKSRHFYTYDSFDGLPDKSTSDESTVGQQYRRGELYASKSQLLNNFRKAHLDPPIVYKAWFHELSSSQLPSELAFAFLDGDFYNSINDSLALAWPRLVRGGVLVVDDYQREALPGVTRAIDEFARSKRINIVYAHQIAALEKP